jgi:hypothetical protein
LAIALFCAVVGTRAIGVGMTGNVKVKGTDNPQASTADLPGDPVNGFVARLLQNQEWGIIVHFSSPLRQVYNSMARKPSAICRIQE